MKVKPAKLQLRKINFRESSKEQARQGMQRGGYVPEPLIPGCYTRTHTGECWNPETQN